MKKNIIYLATACLGALTLVTTSCQKEDAPVCQEPIVVQKPQNVFDQWLRRNYVSPYNIEYKYNVDDSERDHQYVMPPAKMENIMKMSRLVHYAWLGTYDEVVGKNFLRQLSPRVITPYGSWAWDENDGTRTLATAEGGLKVVLYGLNNLDMSSVYVLNEEFFHTMHHEFTHILHQNKKAPLEFNTISAEGYSPTAWFNRRKMEEYATLGFVTAYAAKSTEEDLTEVTAAYITFTQARWDAVFKAAGEEGTQKIKKKIDIMRKYMQSVWNIDMDVLRDVSVRRTEEIISQKDNLILPEWKKLLDPTFRSAKMTDEVRSKREELIGALGELHKGMSKAEAERKHLNCSLITRYMSN